MKVSAVGLTLFYEFSVTLYGGATAAAVCLCMILNFMQLPGSISRPIASAGMCSEKPNGINLKEAKKVLMWTKIYFKRIPFLEQHRNPFTGCPVSRCILTDNRMEVSSSDAVLFYMVDWPKVYAPRLPSTRRPSQRYVFYLMESPVYAAGVRFPGSQAHNISRIKPTHSTIRTGWKITPDFFNWTFTYRLDSDIPVPPLYSTSVAPVASPRDFRQGKTKLVMWVVSHCHTSSKREAYVEDLRKHVAVDVYGNCGQLSCSTDGKNSCGQLLREDYLFYLAFENSLCKDYVTEKLTFALEHDAVPIVLGDGNLTVFPPSSYIQVKDFSSARALAEHLLFLHDNQAAYNKHFDWRYSHIHSRSTGSASADQTSWCKLCEKLHLDESKKTYNSINAWWAPEGVCRGWITI